MLKKRYIYLASRWDNRWLLRPVRDKLVSLGHVVTSRWIDVGEVDYPPDLGAERDIVDLNDADTMVFWPDNLVERTSGKFVEFGYAIAKGYAIYVVHPESSTCIFNKLQRRTIIDVADFNALYKILES
jgi:hypothetical protein